VPHHARMHAGSRGHIPDQGQSLARSVATRPDPVRQAARCLYPLRTVTPADLSQRQAPEQPKRLRADEKSWDRSANLSCSWEVPQTTASSRRRRPECPRCSNRSTLPSARSTVLAPLPRTAGRTGRRPPLIRPSDPSLVLRAPDSRPDYRDKTPIPDALARLTPSPRYPAGYLPDQSSMIAKTFAHHSDKRSSPGEKVFAIIQVQLGFSMGQIPKSRSLIP